MRKALVIGTGVSGLFASVLLAGKGWKVTAMGHATPVSAMSTGCLRTAPGEWGEAFLSILKASGLPMVVGQRTGISNLGTRFDCTASPPRSSWAKGEEPEGLSVIGAEGHPSMRPALVSSVLSRGGIRSEALCYPGKVPSDVPLVSLFHDEEGWERLVDLLKEAGEENVLLPSLFPLPRYDRMKWLEGRGGRRVFEAITPLGIPGQRLVEALHLGAIRAGAEIWAGRRAVSLRMKGNEILGAEVTGGLESREVEFDALFLATGGVLCDGSKLSERRMEDPLGSFEVSLGSDPLHGGYAHRQGHLSLRSGEEAVNAFGAGDCLESKDRQYGSGLSQALESAWAAVKAMEGT